jgi:hypothetical protein
LEKGIGGILKIKLAFSGKFYGVRFSDIAQEIE